MGELTKPALAALALCLVASPCAARAVVAAEPVAAAAPVSDAASRFAAWVVASGDNRGLPFAIVDKVSAEVAVYAADGGLKGAGPALLGSAAGDDSAPGIGDRELSEIAPEERTTPAGRFMAAYGPARGRRAVLWVDYANAISIHRVVTANRAEQRLKRLASPEVDDNRITYGCINVSAAFYDGVVRQAFTGTGGVFYVLPEARRLSEFFPAYRPQAPAVDLASTEQDLALSAEAPPATAPEAQGSGEPAASISAQ